MEKNGKLQITKEELDLFLHQGKLADSLFGKGVESWSHLEDIIQRGEYEVV